MFVFIFVSYIQLHVVVDKHLVATRGGLADGRHRIVVGVAKKEVLEVGSHHDAHGILVAVAHASRDKLVVAGPERDLALKHLGVGLGHDRGLQFK